MCIYHGDLMNGNGKLSEYIKYVYKFITLTTDERRHPQLSYIR